MRKLLFYTCSLLSLYSYRMHKKSGEGGSRGLSEAQKLFMGDFDYYSLSTDYMSDEQMQEWLVIKHIH